MDRRDVLKSGLTFVAATGLGAVEDTSAKARETTMRKIDATITLRDGTVLHRHVEHAIGSLARPMSDADLEAKFRGLCAPVLNAAAIDALVRETWRLESMASAGALAQMSVPRHEP